MPAGGVLDGKYVVQDAAGVGRFGAVYRATHIALQKPVAIKLLHARSTLAARDFERFRVEAEALGRLSHPNIVSVLDFGVDPRDGGTPYLVMELIEGATLDDVMSREGPLDLVRVAPWLRQIAAALDHAHANGVAHGDLTAGNVVLSGAPDARTAKVIDFGLAHLSEDAAAPENTVDGPMPDEASPLAVRVTGTPAYLAPERLRGAPPSPAADVYAVATLAYRLLSARYPHDGDARSVLHAQLAHEPAALTSLVPGVPRAASDAVMAGLRKRADERPARAGDIAHALVAAAERLALARWQQRERPRRIAIAAAVALLLTALGPWLSTRGLVQRLEGATLDGRIALSAPQPPDPRLLLVSIDDEALATDARPLSLRGDEFAGTLERAFAQGARVVALDLLLPEAWASAQRFADLVLTRGDRLVLGVVADDRGVVGPEAIDPLVAGALGPERASRLFALVTHMPAADGVIRSARAGLVDRRGELRPTLAGRVAALAGAVDDELPKEAFVVDYRVDARRFARAGWESFARDVAAGARFDDRIVLVGAEFTGSGDRHRLPRPGALPADATGLTVQAAVVNTILRGQPLREVASGWTWAACALLLFASGLPLLIDARFWRGLALALAAAAMALLLAVALFRSGHVVLLATPLLLWGSALALCIVARQMLPAAPVTRRTVQSRPGGAVRMTRALLLALLTASVAAADTRAAQPSTTGATAPAAIVARVRGEVMADAGAGATRRVRLFDRFARGEILRTGSDGELILVCRSGARFRIAAGSRIEVREDSVIAHTGRAEPLTAVPTVPLVHPVAAAGATITAVRIRGHELTIMRPALDETTLADATVLELGGAAVDGYDVEIEGADAAIVFRAQSEAPRVSIPAGVLRPGQAYRWRAAGRQPTGFTASAEGRFRTLDDAAVRARAALRAAMADDDAEALALLAEIDWAHGLWHEALASFRAAAAAGITDPVVDERIADLAARLAPRKRAKGG